MSAKNGFFKAGQETVALGLGLCRADFGRGRSRVGRCDWVVAMAEDASLALARIQKADWGSSPEPHVCACVCF